MDTKTLADILDKHKKWLANDPEGERADLRGANLSEADLSGANLSGADLRGANLGEIRYDEHTAFFALQCPETGAFIGWKRCGEYIVKLQITESAKRSSATSRKCRCSEALVLAIQNEDGTEASINEVASNRTDSFVYRIGETARVEDFDNDRWEECAPGIHFFITRDEAVNWR